MSAPLSPFPMTPTLVSMLMLSYYSLTFFSTYEKKKRLF